MLRQLEELGFEPADQKKDFSYLIPYVFYLKRTYLGQNQYVSLVTYEGAFCEAVVEIFYNAKDTRKRQIPLYCAIHRDFAGIEEAVEKTYPVEPHHK